MRSYLLHPIGQEYISLPARPQTRQFFARFFAIKCLTTTDLLVVMEQVLGVMERVPEAVMAGVQGVMAVVQAVMAVVQGVMERVPEAVMAVVQAVTEEEARLEQVGVAVEAVEDWATVCTNQIGTESCQT